MRNQGFRGFWRGIRGAFVNFGKMLRARWKKKEVPDFFSPDAPDKKERISYKNLVLSTQYEPRPYGGDVLVYRVPSNNFSAMFERTASWGEVALGGVRVVDLEGTHTSILQQPTIEWIAQDISLDLNGRN